MITFLILFRIRNFFLSLKNPWKIVLNLGLLLTSWFYGRFLAELINKAGNGELGGLIPERILNYALVFIFIMTIVRMILPAYTPQRQLFHKYYPLSRFQRYASSVLSEIQSSFFLYFVICLFIGFWYLDFLKLRFLSEGLSVLFSAHLVRRILQYPIDNKLRRAGFISFFIALLFITMLVLYSDFFVQNLNYSGILVPVILFLLGFLLECQVVENKKFELLYNSRKGNLFLKLLMNNPKVRVTLLVGLGFKTFILAADFLLFTSKGKHIFNGQFIYWLFISPLLLFNYVFNNTWGFWKNIWLNFELRSGDYRDMIKFHLRLLTIPLIIDALITLPVLLITWQEYQFILIYYFVSLWLLICASLVWALLFPMTIVSTFQMKGTSSFISSLVMMISVSALYLIKLNYWFYILIPIYLILSFGAYNLAVGLYKEKKYLLAGKLMKE